MAPGTKTRLLDATYTLMLSRGYSATSVDEICERAEVSKGSFYHFFESKQDLALQMVEHHMAGARDTIEHGLDLAGVEGAERAIRYVKHVEQVSEEVWSEGCLIGSLALELADSHPEMQEKLSQIFRSLADDFEKIFVPLCREQRGSDRPGPRELAEQLIMVIEGGVVLSKAHNDRRYVPNALRCFRRYLEMLVRE